MNKSIVSILIERISLLLLLVKTITVHGLSWWMPHGLCETNWAAVVVLIVLGGVGVLVYIGVVDVILVVLDTVGQVFIVGCDFRLVVGDYSTLSSK
jgi:hypothetical protein